MKNGKNTTEESISLLKIMKSVIDASEKIVLEKHVGDLNIRRNRYAQLRCMGLAHAIFNDIVVIIEINKSARTVELLLRPLIELYVNFMWLGIGRGIGNYAVFVADDNYKVARQIDHILKFHRKIGSEQKEIEDWTKVQDLNHEQAKHALKLTTVLDGTETFPSITKRAQEIDLSRDTKNAFEWLVLYPYSFAHRAVHVSNSWLNHMVDEETGEILLDGSPDQLEHAAVDALSIFLGMLTDYQRIFKIEYDLEQYWDMIPNSRL
ncbi:MAG: DUF5677 domain-containing protein [Candidatus Saccharimonadales bacterium]